MPLGLCCRWLLAGLVMASFGCDGASAPTAAPKATSPEPAPVGPPGKAPAAAYGVPERTPAELERDLARTCAEARDNRELVLLEFSAPWCKDCVRLQALKQEPVLEQALGRYRELSVNIGDFDQHPSLLAAFAVRSIAHWELLAPTDCSAPPWRWGRLGRRTLEPETGQRVSAEELARWLTARIPT